ncbi:MAG: hypothetical protein KF699_16305 [Phycisphaeraceae bacterium]|nr:hypothetical protein [Phycisphaeraceae bacterium]
MESTTPPPAKACTRCGQDCAGKPRVKDQHGRYTCQACLDRIKAERAAPAGPEPPPSAPEPEGFDVFALEPSADDTRTSPCRNCGRPLPESAALCVSCGFNRKLGRVMRDNDVAAALTPPPPTAQPLGRRIKCGQCGYDLRGITGMKCPECGASALAPTRREKDKENSVAVAREAYIKPLIYFAVGFGVVSLIQLFSNSPMHAVAYAIGYAIQVPIGVAVFWVCCLVWIGFDAPIHLTALRLAGIYALVDLADVIFKFVPIPLVGWVLPLFIYIGLLMDLLEMDLQDTVIVALITFMVKAVITIFVVARIYGFI